MSIAFIGISLIGKAKTEEEVYAALMWSAEDAGRNYQTFKEYQIMLMSEETKKYKVKHCIQTCSACPSQWDIYTDEDKYIYVRYRWGVLSVTLNAFQENEEELLYESIGEDLDGYLETEHLIMRTKSVLDWSGSRIFER